MKRSTHWLVADHGVRPAGPPDRCFYCGEQVGKEHKEGCVIRCRTVVVKFSIDLVVDVPEDWCPEMIESKYNESSWCADTFLMELEGTIQRMNKNGDCLCGALRAEFVREASEHDERAQSLHVNELPN